MKAVNQAHTHSFIFLRQEERNVGYDRNPTWEIWDVFFCTDCLAYQRVKVRVELPGIDSFKRRVVEGWAEP